MSKAAQPPPAPDPTVVANAQTGTNISSAVANKTLNNTNTVTPYGSTTYAATGGYTDPQTGQWVPQYTQNTSLTPLAQSLLTGTETTANSLLPTGQALADEAGSAATKPLDFSGANENVLTQGPQALDANTTNALYSQQKTFLDPQWSQQETDIQDQLSRQGIPVGSDAYNRAMTNFNNSKTQAYNAAQQGAIGGGVGAASNLFNMALQGQQQNVAQQQTAQQRPLQLLSMIYGGGGASPAAGGVG